MQGSGHQLIIGAAGWAVVTLLAAGPAPDRETWLGSGGLETMVHLASLAVALVACLIIAWLMGGTTSKTGFSAPERRVPWRLMVAAAAVCAIALVRPELIANVLRRLRPRADAESGPTGPVAPALDESPVPANPPPTAGEAIELVGLVAVGLMAAALIWWAVRRSAEHAETAEPSGTAHAAELIVATTQAHHALVTRVGDERAAVIEAYVRLEHHFDEAGFGRAPSETPSEHLRRATAGLDVSAEPFTRLCVLYSRARFSGEAITTTDVAEAAGQLATATRTLGDATPV